MLYYTYTYTLWSDQCRSWGSEWCCVCSLNYLVRERGEAAEACVVIHFFTATWMCVHSKRCCNSLLWLHFNGHVLYSLRNVMTQLFYVPVLYFNANLDWNPLEIKLNSRCKTRRKYTTYNDNQLRLIILLIFVIQILQNKFL